MLYNERLQTQEPQVITNQPKQLQAHCRYVRIQDTLFTWRHKRDVTTRSRDVGDTHIQS